SCWNSSPSTPARAFPSSTSSASMSASCRSEALGPDPLGFVAERHECRRDRLDEARGPAHEARRGGPRLPGNLCEHCLIDAAATPRPPCRRLARERVDDLDTVEIVETLELGRVDDVGRATPRRQEPNLGIAAAGCAMAQHRHQRNDARAASDEQPPPGGARFPHEIAADRAAQLELIAGAELVDEVRRDTAVLEPLERA